MEHFYKDVEGWAAFTDLYAEAVRDAKSGDAFVEVGSWLGRSAAFMGVEIINSKKNITLFCVDPWEDGGPDLRDTSYFKDLKEPPFDIFKRNVKPVEGYIVPLRMTSIRGAATFYDETVSFLMLDGDHSYEAVKADIAAWLPKMKKGGVISGDDYLWPGVTKAVHEAFGDKVEPVIKHNKANYRNGSSYWSVQL